MSPMRPPDPRGPTSTERWEALVDAALADIIRTYGDPDGKPATAQEGT